LEDRNILTDLPISVRVAAIATAGICAVSSFSGCSRSTVAEVNGSNAVAVENPSTSQLISPPGFLETPLWSVPFISTPQVVDEGFAGILGYTEASDSATVQVLGDTGAPRFGVDVPANRLQFAVASVRGRELLITQDVGDTDSDNIDYLTARDTRTGEIVWGPVRTQGCLTGTGLLIDADCNAAESNSAEGAVSAADGHTIDLSGAVTEFGGHAVVADGDRNADTAARSSSRIRTIHRCRGQLGDRCVDNPYSFRADPSGLPSFGRRSPMGKWCSHPDDGCCRCQ
jgi:hypothetical protein